MKTNSFNHTLNHLFLALLTGLLLAACDTPQTPVGRPSIKPSASASASPVVSNEPLCYQTLECVRDSTISNGLRKEVQLVITELFNTAEPKYTQLCKSKADELSENIPACIKTGTPSASPVASPSTQVKPSPSTLPKPSPSTN